MGSVLRDEREGRRGPRPATCDAVEGALRGLARRGTAAGPIPDLACHAADLGGSGLFDRYGRGCAPAGRGERETPQRSRGRVLQLGPGCFFWGLQAGYVLA